MTLSQGIGTDRVREGYYLMAVEWRRDAHEQWTGVLAECLLDLEQVAEAAPVGLVTDLQFSRLRKPCRQYVNLITSGSGGLVYCQLIMAKKRGR